MKVILVRLRGGAPYGFVKRRRRNGPTGDALTGGKSEPGQANHAPKKRIRTLHGFDN